MSSINQSVFRGVYFEPQEDQALGALADTEGITKAELVRRFVKAGLKAAASRTKRRHSTKKTD